VSEPAILGTIRASSWPTLFDCSLRWYYQNVLGLRTPSHGKSQLGTALHKATAVYDAPGLVGAPGSLGEATDALMQTLQQPQHPVEWDDDFKPAKAEAIGLALTKNYAEQIAPKHEYRAIEVNCNALDITTEAGVVRISGTTDRVRVTEDGREGISDIKSGGRAVAADGRAVTKGHHLQTGIYRIMAEAALERVFDAPDEIIGLQVAANARVGCAEISDSRTPLVGDEDAPGLIEMAARMLKSGIFPPNPRSMLCSPTYCGGYSRCKFHD
jgi:RecB family exonuclease